MQFGGIRGEAEDRVLVPRRWALTLPRRLSAFALPLAKGLSACVGRCGSGVQEMVMELSHFTWSRRAWIMRTIMRLFVAGRIERVAKSLPQ